MAKNFEYICDRCGTREISSVSLANAPSSHILPKGWVAVAIFMTAPTNAKEICEECAEDLYRWLRLPPAST